LEWVLGSSGRISAVAARSEKVPQRKQYVHDSNVLHRYYASPIVGLSDRNPTLLHSRE